MTTDPGHAVGSAAILNVPSATDRCMRGKEPVIRDDGSIEIPLTKGQTAVVDAASYHLVRDLLWTAAWHEHTRGYYAIANVRTPNGTRRYRTAKMHRVVLGLSNPDIHVDHENHDTLDNRSRNISSVTHQQNLCNQSPRRHAKKSRFKGVTKRENGVWRAYITVNKRRTWLGQFTDEEAAARAYDEAAIRLHGEHSFTNVAAGLL